MDTTRRTIQLVGLVAGWLAIATNVSAQQNSTCRWVPGVGWRCRPPQVSDQSRGTSTRQTPADEIVRVIAPLAGGSRAQNYGSGVLVVGPDDLHGWVLTAEHVTRDRRDVMVVMPGGTRYPGIVAASDRADDVALLRIEKPPIKPRRVANDSPALGAEVYLAGFPAGGAYRSWVTRRIRLYESKDRLEVAGHAENGTSGGPMIDARGRGAVQGILRLMIRLSAQ